MILFPKSKAYGRINDKKAMKAIWCEETHNFQNGKSKHTVKSDYK